MRSTLFLVLFLPFLNWVLSCRLLSIDKLILVSGGMVSKYWSTFFPFTVVYYLPAFPPSVLLRQNENSYSINDAIVETCLIGTCTV